MGRHNDWHVMKRSFVREYPHQVRLAHTGDWRSTHIAYALRNSRPLADWRWWTERNDVSGDLVGVRGFKAIEGAVGFEMWATASGIDWGLRPTDQPAETRPPQPAEDMRHVGLAVYRIVRLHELIKKPKKNPRQAL